MNPETFSYGSMGTTWKVTFWDVPAGTNIARIEKDVVAMSEEFDRTYSRFIRTSLVWKIAEKAGRYEVPEDFARMLRIYFDLYEPSGKKLNPLIGFTISDLGYDDQYSLVTKDNVRKTPDLAQTVKLSEEGGIYFIETSEPVLFDFGALGKGYFVDRITAYLRSVGARRFLVDGSGDIYYSGGPEHIAIKAGLEHPADAKLAIGTVDISEGAFCASGINRRKWDKHHHVIDPHANASTGEDIIATWVIADSAALSDALASCLFFVSPEALASYKFEYVIMNSESRIKKSPGWSGEFF